MERTLKISYTVDRLFGGLMKFLEYLYYESLPFFYAGLSLFAFMNAESSKIVIVAGALLAFCSYQVFYKRYFYRTYTSHYKKQMRI